MRPGSYLVQAYERHTWRVQFSLPANISTAMLLINSKARGETTPTSWPDHVLPRLSTQAFDQLHAMRALLAYGAVLRSFLLEQLPPDSPAQHDWSSLLVWLENLLDTAIEQLLGYGIRANLEFCRLYPQTPHVPEQDLVLEQLDADESLIEDEAFKHSAILAILDSWEIEQRSWETEQHGPVPDLTERRAPALALVEHPACLRTAIVEFLQELWRQGFSEEWEQHRLTVAAAVEDAQTWLEKEAFTCLPDEVIFRVTGLQLPEEWLPMLHRASTIVFVPCLQLGKYLSLSAQQDTLYILYDPISAQSKAGQLLNRTTVAPTILAHTKKDATQVQRAPSSLSSLAEEKQAYSSTFQTLDLETLGPIIRTLGDTTSLTILMVLAEHGEMFAQQVAEHLHVHQSTTSRHFAQLERTGLVSVRPEGGMKFYSANRQRIKDICQLLLKTFA